MPVPKIYETVQKESDDVKNTFNENIKKGQTIQEAVKSLEKDIRGKIMLSYKLYNPNEDDYFNRMHRKGCVELKFVNEAKYTVLFDAAWNVAHNRSFFSWFIHPFRNYQERKFLNAWKEEIERPSNLEAKAKDADNKEPIGIGIEESRQNEYLDIAEKEYDENGLTYSQEDNDKVNPYDRVINAYDEEMKKLDEEAVRAYQEEMGEENQEEPEMDEENEIEPFENGENVINASEDEIKVNK